MSDIPINGSEYQKRLIVSFWRQGRIPESDLPMVAELHGTDLSDYIDAVRNGQPYRPQSFETAVSDFSKALDRAYSAATEREAEMERAEQAAKEADAAAELVEA